MFGMFGELKNFVSLRRTSAKYISLMTVSVAIIVATNTANYAAKLNGYQILVVCCTSVVSKCTLPSMGGDSLSYFDTLNFLSQMAKYKENASMAKHSNHTRATELQLQQAATLPEVSNVLIRLCEQLGEKVELHVHFVIQSTVYGNNLCGEDITVNDVKTNNGNVGVRGNDNTVVAGDNLKNVL